MGQALNHKRRGGQIQTTRLRKLMHCASPSSLAAAHFSAAGAARLRYFYNNPLRRHKLLTRSTAVDRFDSSRESGTPGGTASATKDVVERD